MILYITDEDEDFAKRFGVRGFEVTSITHSNLTEESASGFYEGYDAVVIDQSSRSGSPLDALRSVRGSSAIPVLCVAASATPVECVVALELGADDFVRWPIDKWEFTARINRIMRRPTGGPGPSSPQTRIVADDVQLVASERIVLRDGERLSLTTTEFNLLHLLMTNVGTLVTRDEISRSVFNSGTKVKHRSIDVHMSSLRKKLGKRAGGDERIRTVHGAGYVYVISNV